MAHLVTVDGLKDALVTFRERGDERWASRDEAVTADEVATIIGESVGGLTDVELAEVIQSL